MKMIVIGLMSLVGVSISAPVFAGCEQDVEVLDFTVETTPAIECLEFDMANGECTGGGGLVINNNCETMLTLVLNNRGPDSYEVVIDSAEQQTLWLERDGDVTTISIPGVLGEEEVTINLEYTSRITNDYSDGCFASTTGKPNLTPLLLLGFFAFMRRR